MNKVLDHLQRVYKRLISSIAFIPTVMVFGAFLLAVFIFSIDGAGDDLWLEKNLKFVLVHGADNARMVLTTIVGGILSLTVFSFSMVMIVLNRASASLSPRILPQLVAQKFHQFVLGFYMGTIVYSLILIVNLGPDKDLPAVGILLSMIFAISSLGLFIYFIHSISQSIQVDHILKNIFKRTIQQIHDIKEKQEETDEEIDEFSSWEDEFPSWKNGYFQLINIKQLTEFLKEHAAQIEICVYPGQFMAEGTNLVKTNIKGLESEMKNILKDSFYTSNNVEIEDEYYMGLRKISEVAVKALSPGINDPGTALAGIRILTMLFNEILPLKAHVYYADDDGNTRIFRILPSLDTLLFENITPIRQYSGGSLSVLVALFEFYLVLFGLRIQEANETLGQQAQALINTADRDITNPQDREKINMCIEKINGIGGSSVLRFKPLLDKTID